MEGDIWKGMLVMIAVAVCAYILGITHKGKDPVFYIKRVGKCEDGGHIYIFEKSDVDNLFKDALEE